MMTLKINRIKQNNKFTRGKFELLDNDQVLQKGATLELGMGECIDKGEYNVRWYYSPKNKLFVPLLYSDTLNENRYIEIHVGNTTKDTQGCILVGKYPIGNGDSIGESRLALYELQFNTKFQDFKVIIS
ncbi:hypothetical protein KVK66_04415 [Helicobacter pylori]|nr:hypothetical protein KVK66_04415 [Helicobacter pylori]